VLKVDDLESLWTYVYFGYGNGKARVFVQFANQEGFSALEFDNLFHDLPTYLRLVIGGPDVIIFHLSKSLTSFPGSMGRSLSQS
jgi:hypothetical protein